MHLVIPVAVKPFILKYISADYPVNPFELTTTNKYGMFLYHCLDKPEKRPLRLVTNQTVDESVYSANLMLKVTEKRWREIGCILTPESILHFNKFVQQDFNDEFFKYVKNRVGPKGTIYRAIHTFRNSYDISEDEFSYKSMERAFQRRNAATIASLSA